MGLNLGAMGGAAGDSLEDILKQKFLEQIQKGHLAIAKQQADDNTALRMEAQKSAAEDRAARQQSALSAEGTRIGGNLTPGADVTGQSRVIQALTAAGLAPQHKDATLGSTNLSGIVSPAAPSLQGDAVPGVRLARTANPGQAAKDIYGGTDKQREQQQQEDALKALAADPNTPDHIRQFLQVRSAVPGGVVPSELFKQEKPTQKIVAPGGYVLDENNKQVFHAPPNPHEAPTVVIQTTDDKGNNVTKIVPKVAGASYGKGPDATTSNRLQSAKAVVQTGNDIIASLRDPAIAAELGPAMSRYNSVADFVGNPPPKFAKLAGQIESFSLANMGVHGMRSNTGAEAIKHTIGVNRHTPESMISVLEGLNGFANHLLENNHQSATGNDAAATTAADLIKKYGG